MSSKKSSGSSRSSNVISSSSEISTPSSPSLPISPSSIVNKVSKRVSSGRYPLSSYGAGSDITSPGILNSKSSKHSSSPLFEVEVRKRGEWAGVSKGFGFSEQEAFQKGLVEVGTSARASFRITKARKNVVKKRFFGRGMIGDFYKKGNVFIEKRSRRIKSKGELEQITYKGQRAIKSKSIMSKMKLWGK